MGPITMVTALMILSCVENSLGMSIVESRRCPGRYIDGYWFHDTIVSYDDAVKLCESNDGKLPLPTDNDWENTLEYLRKRQSTSNHKEEGDWIGMTAEKDDTDKIIVKDSDRTKLTDKQRTLIPITDENILEQLKDLHDSRGCIVYFPPDSKGHSDWYFQLQACGKMGVKASARAVCKCISYIEKDVPKEKPVLKKIVPELPKSATQTGNNESTVLMPKGRAGPGPVDMIPNGKDNNDAAQSGTNSTSSLVAVIGVLVACCLLGTTYYVMKRQGWDVRRMISRRMPYNRPRPSLNGGGDLYLRGQELTDIPCSSRPIHVYEEIIPRNRAGAFIAPASQRRNVISSASSVNMPQLPPPDPPAGCLPPGFTTEFVERAGKSREDGYMQPSFRRNDTIPGDVRSPLPMESNVFTFPIAKPIPKMSTLQVPKEKELKYASVETVQTLLDDENGDRDEEYFVDENDSGVNVSTESREEELVVDLPEEKCQPDINEKTSTTNSYVQIIDNLSPISGMAGCDAISPVFVRSNDYENERFLTTVMKVPPVKPKRKTKTTQPMLEPQIPTSSDSVVYARIPSVSKEPVYSQVKRKEDRKQPTERYSGAYTPMRSDTLRREEQQPLNSTETNTIQATTNEVLEVPQEIVSKSPYTEIATRTKNFISSPSIISTTNKALEDSSLVCYEIPPEYEDIP